MYAAMSAEILARIQFAFTISFHYLFPPLSIGLSIFILMIEGAYLKTKNERYREMAKFWVKVFGLTFAMGVATGIVQALEFGTNWATFSRYVGDVFGAALGAEGVFAFLMEAGFLAVLLFGWDRVGPKMHFFSAFMVSLGAHFSAVWIVVANSWMQTPAGFTITGEGMTARAEITGFWEMIFNPSSMERLTHVLLGCWLAGTFIVISICAYYLLKGRHTLFARTNLKLAMVLGSILILAQGFSGDRAATTVTKYQPAKLAAMEGVFKTQERAPAYLFGWVDAKNEKVYGVGVPGLLSLLAYRDINATVLGYDAFPADERPNVSAVFQTYHMMLAMWGAMFFTLILAWWSWKKFSIGKRRWVLWIMVFSVLFPQIANQTGWYTAEMGRQPWVVYGMLRTSEGLSKVVSANQILGSIIMFFVIYLALFSLFIFLMDRKIKHGPANVD